jgi:predicted ester cyclase
VTNQENTDVIHRFIDEVNRKGAAAEAERFIAADYRDHSAPPGFPTGPQGWRLMRSQLFGAFDDVHITAEDIVAEGDKVAVRFTMKAVHRGEFMGLPPTGKEVVLKGMDINRIEGGKLAERWGNEDMLGFLQQLGAIPAPAK